MSDIRASDIYFLTFVFNLRIVIILAIIVDIYFIPFQCLSQNSDQVLPFIPIIKSKFFQRKRGLVFPEDVLFKTLLVFIHV